MTDLTDRSLREAARLYGVAITYGDVDGVPRQASPQVIVTALRSLGAPVTHAADAGEAVRARRLEAWRRLVPPVLVIEADSSAATIPVRALTAEAPRRLTWTLRFEGGPVRSGRVRLNDLPLIRGGRIEGRDREVRRLRIPGPLPAGYHRVEISLGSRRASCLLVAAPPRAWGAERRERDWGVFQPLYGLRHAHDWGTGDLPALGRLAAWSGSLGGRIVGTLPLLSTFLDDPFDPGPYRPVSRLFWSELFVDPTTAPELESSPAARARLIGLHDELAELREAPLVDYRRTAAARHAILSPLAETFFAGRGSTQPAFLRFLANSPELGDFARFRAMGAEEGDPDPAVARMHIYAQWLFARQLSEVRTRAAGTGLYLDFPVGVHPDGYDVWRDPSLFAEGVSVGAPPDSFFAEGQVWKTPPMLPERMRENQFRYLRQSLATSMKPADLLRLDPVMFMQRLYWVPEGMPAGMGVYVAYPAEEIAAVVRLESHRAECEVVGEDLGTVTEEVRALMDRGGLRRMFVLDLALNRLEADPASFVPAGAVASLNTHDTPPFAAQIHGDDIEDRVRLGQLPQENEAGAREERRRQLEQLFELIGTRKGAVAMDSDSTEPQPGQVSPALEPALRLLGISPARFVVVSVDDLLGVREPQNVPGTTTERPNWRRRSPLAIEALASDDSVREILLALDAARQSAPGEDG